MRRIALIGAASALVAAGPPEMPHEGPPPQEPGYGPSAEPCLADPSAQPAPTPDALRRAAGCTTEEAEAAIQRQCAIDEQSGTADHAACLGTRRMTASLVWWVAVDPPPPADTAPSPTTWEDASRACRGQTWRRPSETVRACTERLVSTDALSRPLPQGREPAEPRCRRETVRREDGTGFSVSVRCQETTIVPAGPR